MNDFLKNRMLRKNGLAPALSFKKEKKPQCNVRICCIEYKIDVVWHQDMPLPNLGDKIRMNDFELRVTHKVWWYISSTETWCTIYCEPY